MSKSFDDYKREALTSSGVGASPVSRKTPKLDLSKLASAKKETESAPQDPLSWMVDMLSRPLRTQTERIDSIIDTQKHAAEKQAQGDTLGAIGEQVGGFFDQNLGAGIRGLFSTDKEDQRQTGDLIEKAVDTAGGFDPSYKDQQDNVNPVLKGVAGFVGDVALDPLTYVPGAAFASVGKKLAGLAKIGRGGAEAVRDAQRASELTRGTADLAESGARAVDNEVSTAARVERPTPESTVDATAAKIEEAAGPTPEMILEQSRKAMSDARLTPRAGELGEGLAKIKPTTIEVEVAKAGKATSKTPLAFGDWMKAAASDMETLTTKQVPVITNGKQKITLPELMVRAEAGDAQAVKVLEQWHTKNYLPSFAKAKQAGQAVNALGRIAPAVAPKSTVVEETLNSLQTFKKQVAEDQAGVEAVLGKPLVSSLMKMSNPAKFDTTVQRLSGILGGQLDVHHLAKSNYSNPVKDLLRELGVDADAVPVGVRKPQAEKGSGRSANLQEMLARMDGEPVTDLTTRLAESSLKHTVVRDILEPVKPGTGWDYMTKNGVNRNRDLWGDGYGRRWREANTYFQYTSVNQMLRDVTAELKKVNAGAKGAFTAGRKHDEVLKALRVQERYLEEAGVIHTIGLGADRIPISLSQVLDVLDDAGGHTNMRLFFWNQGTAVPVTALMDGVYQALKTGDRAKVLEALSATTTRYGDAAGALRNMDNNLVRGGRFGAQVYGGNELPPQLADHIMERAGQLDSVVSMNDSAWKTRVASEVYDMTDDTLERLRQAYESEVGYGPALQAISDTSSRIKARGSEIGATQKAVDATDAIVDQAVPLGELANARKAIAVTEAAGAAAKNTTNLDTIQRVGIERAQRGFEEYVEGTFTPGGDVRDLGQKVDQMLGRGLLSKLMPVVSRRAGAEQLHEPLVRSEVVLKGLVSDVDHRLSRIGAALPAERFAGVLKNVQHGIPNPDPELAKYHDEVADIWSQMFGSGERNTLLDNAFFRENSNIHHVNSLLDYFKAGKTFDVEAAEQAAKANSTNFLDELAKQASDWDITDPLDFMSKTYKAFATTQVHQNLAHSFVKMAKDMGAISRTPKHGYSLVGNDSGKSIMAKYLPSDMYFDDKVLRQMNVVDNLMQDSIKWDSPIKDFIDNVFKPTQDAWKYGMTLINPSHHIRNAVSDASMTFYANGVKGAAKSYKSAAQAMASHNGYSNWDAIKMLQFDETLPDAGKVVSKGRHGEITAAGLYQAAANRGNLPTFKQLENLEEDGRGKIAQAWQGFTNTRGAQAIGGVSEARDHYFRLAHFSQTVDQLIDSPKFKSLEEVLDEASAQTRRWHPDGTDMTSVERDVFRMIVPFYSWQRKAIPMIVEAMLMHPGRVMAIPKAQYNAAVAAGINPDSMSNPFPDDQMFPSYLTEQIGGPLLSVDGKYFGLNPGFAANDVLNDYGAGGEVAMRSVLGSVSPLIRSPFELASGGNVGTGAQINDESDYIDSNIPVVGPLSRITGTSVSGTLGNLLGGKFEPDQQYQVAQGNKEGLELLPLLNYLSGLGITPMSQPNQINYAEIEARDRAKGEK